VADEGPCVIVGRSADYILRDYEGLISVFIHADKAFRAERIKEEYKVSDDKVMDMLAKTDKKRASYYNFQSEKKWGAATSYNICLDTSVLGIDHSVDLLTDYIRYRRQGR
jgi:cytidylate kinase